MPAKKRDNQDEHGSEGTDAFDEWPAFDLSRKESRNNIDAQDCSPSSPIPGRVCKGCASKKRNEQQGHGSLDEITVNDASQSTTHPPILPKRSPEVDTGLAKCAPGTALPLKVCREAAVKKRNDLDEQKAGHLDEIENQGKAREHALARYSEDNFENESAEDEDDIGSPIPIAPGKPGRSRRIEEVDVGTLIPFLPRDIDERASALVRRAEQEQALKHGVSKVHATLCSRADQSLYTIEGSEVQHKRLDVSINGSDDVTVEKREEMGAVNNESEDMEVKCCGVAAVRFPNCTGKCHKQLDVPLNKHEISKFTKRDGAINQVEGQKLNDCVLVNANWCGTELPSYTDETGCKTVSSNP